jgi:deoxyhypusine synthase
LLSGLARFGGLAAQVARGAKALEAMIHDKHCARFLTVSGAMTVGKMDLIICDMIEQGMIQAISSTGALMAHGLVSSIGLKHYKYNPKYDDTELARRKLNRVTDTLEPETNLDTVEEVIGKVIEKIDGKEMFRPDRAEQADRQTSRRTLSERPRHSEVGLSARRAGVRAGFCRFRVGQRHLHPQHQAAAARQRNRS